MCVVSVCCIVTLSVCPSVPVFVFSVHALALVHALVYAIDRKDLQIFKQKTNSWLHL